MNPTVAVEHMKGWVHTTVGELCDRYGGEAQTGPFGSQLHAVDYQAEGGTPVIMPVDIRDRSIDTTRIVRIGERKKLELARHRVREGDVLFARRGDVGRFAVVSEQESGWICGTGCLRVRLNVPDVHSAFLAHYLGRSEVKEWLLREAKGTTMLNLNTSILRKLPLVLPPLAEQRRLAAILDRAEALRAKRRHALSKLDILNQSLFVHRFGDSVEKSKGCRTALLGTHLPFVTSGGRGWAEFYSSAGSRFVRSLDVQMNRISDDEPAYVTPPDSAEARRTMVKVGDVLLTITGSRIGRVAPVPEKLASAFISQHVAILRTDPTVIDPVFLSFFLSLKSGGQRQIAKAQYGQTKPGLNFEQIRSFRIPLPPLPLQREFAAQVSAVEWLKAAQRASLAKLDALFASLQHRAFRGEL
jgi:type I restriction enzyme, S subunit